MVREDDPVPPRRRTGKKKKDTSRGVFIVLVIALLIWLVASRGQRHISFGSGHGYLLCGIQQQVLVTHAEGCPGQP
jgi:hypothetical protein